MKSLWNTFKQSMSVCGCAGAVCAGLLLAACGDSGTTENVYNQTGLDIVATVADLPTCGKDNDGEQVFVKAESGIRVCTDGKWYAIASGSDSLDIKGVCTTEALSNSSGVKIICGGDSVGVVLNGADGAQGEQGIHGEKGDTGADGKDGTNGVDGTSCTVVALADDSGLKVLCGDDSVGVILNGADGQDGKDGANSGTPCALVTVDCIVNVACGDDTVSLDIASTDEFCNEVVVLDSEKIAISLDTVSGVTQKGPFLSGSKVLVKEFSDGRTLIQTGSTFNGKILNDNGQFKITARMLVSQYVMLQADGYYRNEVTGENSSSPLTLFAITDVNDRNIVNVNLLTNLEYERVFYLVTKKKMKVKAAKKQAEKEIFDLLHIDAANFSYSEDLNIAGSSDEDGALLAFSVMLQGDRSVSELTTLLTNISSDLEQDGSWDDAATKLAIADWSAKADSANRLATIRKNVENWGLSSMVPKFEKYIRNFWTQEYGLDSCTSDKVGEVAAATAGAAKDTKTRYTCVDSSGVGLMWRTATDYEKDTYGWTAGDDGQVKVGDVTGDKYYLYDGVAKAWRKATDQEQLLGGCIASIETDASKNTGMVNGYWYKCESRTWVKTSAFIVDTQGWLEGSDGSLKAGDSTGVWYVWDEYENAWRNASTLDYTLGFNGCTTNRTGEMGRAESYGGNFYQCATDHMWTMVTGTAAINTKDIACDEEGKYITGIVHTKTHFVCDAGTWREATTEEEQAECSCTAASTAHFNDSETKFCENGAFHDATIYDYDVDKKNYFNSDLTYGTLTDARDGHVYKTIKIGEQVWMAENLQFADSISYIYLKGNSWCYNNLEKNCQIGGRYYTWTAAMDIDSKWQNATVPEGTIKTPHQGICPEGWHIPTDDEWTEMYNATGATSDALQARGTLNWVDATNSSGFSALPVGYYYGSNFSDVGSGAFFWSSPEGNDVVAYGLHVYADYAGVAGGYAKERGFAVRCLKDS